MRHATDAHPAYVAQLKRVESRQCGMSYDATGAWATHTILSDGTCTHCERTVYRLTWDYGYTPVTRSGDTAPGYGD